MGKLIIGGTEEMDKEKTKFNQKGITLIALVITMIVLLILAGVSITMLAGENGILTKANDASESTNQENIKEEIELLLQEAYISEYIDDIDKMEYLKTKLLEAGAESLWDSESYSKEYWKYKDAVIIINPDKYTINFTKNTLVNNEGNSEDKGFLVDISQGGIPRKDIESIIFSSNKIPENYTISYDVSESKDEQVVLYGVQNANGRYDVTIVAANNEEIYAPEYSARLFGDLTNLKTINLDNLNTSNVTNMYIMLSKLWHFLHKKIANFSS